MKQNKVDILAISKSRISGDQADKVCNRLFFMNKLRVEAKGFSGGIWLLWSEANFVLQIISSSNYFIHAYVNKGMKAFHTVVVYAPLSVQRRRIIWEETKNKIRGIDGPLFIGGDFTCITNLEERQGGANALMQDSVVFVEWIII